MTISLMSALRMTPNADASELSLSWIDWSAKYPEEKNSLSPAYITALDALAGIVTATVTVQDVIDNLKTAYDTAIAAFNTAMLAVPGVGAASSALEVSKIAMETLMKLLGELIVSLYKNTIKILKSLVNVNVADWATL